MNDYQIPAYVIRCIVGADETAFRQRVRMGMIQCPLLGYSHIGRRAPLDRKTGYPLEDVRPDGCSALQSPVCYSRGPSNRHHLQVSTSEECPVYQEVMRILAT